MEEKQVFSKYLLKEQIHYFIIQTILKKKKILFQKTVIQRFPLSPSLFNIYLDAFYKISLQNSIRNQFFIVDYRVAEQFIQGNWQIMELKIKQTKIRRYINPQELQLFWQLQLIKLQYITKLVKQREELIIFPINFNGSLLVLISNKELFSLGIIYINPHVTYSNLAIQTAYNKTPKNDLIKLQRNSLKYIAKLLKSKPNRIIDILIKTNKSSQVPKNLNELYCLQGKIFNIHLCKMNDQHIIEQVFGLKFKELQVILKEKNKEKQRFTMKKRLEK